MNSAHLGVGAVSPIHWPHFQGTCGLLGSAGLGFFILGRNGHEALLADCEALPARQHGACVAHVPGGVGVEPDESLGVKL
jgi:hypothetical protein